ncbi:hypothetical protein FB106_12026 [Synechococcus sp. Ace-Pa]|uniref:hypothetical protein n=1 Tax=Synechococcaceae TaxID=1890426 RepID=UPI0011A8B340|nr:MULTISPECIES: hypothetical protein [Synechococcaceae]MCT4364785.1 hypothetical protein [Candidatus Regnicoccus frigidus MAG-AL1]MCT4366449.1 hypothetical protein [Candidatus Regnicoccus frigidus MAG-AL2]TWB87691.1 hypothetical protein FB106_12026 [Synechococcus sp. Ace-Pa]
MTSSSPDDRAIRREALRLELAKIRRKLGTAKDEAERDEILAQFGETLEVVFALGEELTVC